MWKNKRHPTWWLLYLGIAVIMGLFLLELQRALNLTENRAIELFNIVLLYGCVWVWLKANEVPLIREDQEKQKQVKR